MLSAALDALDVDDFAIDAAQIEAMGRITPSDTGIAGVTADLEVGLTGMAHTDPDLNEAHRHHDVLQHKCGPGPGMRRSV